MRVSPAPRRMVLHPCTGPEEAGRGGESSRQRKLPLSNDCRGHVKSPTFKLHGLLKLRLNTHTGTGFTRSSYERAGGAGSQCVAAGRAVCSSWHSTVRACLRTAP